MPKDKKLAPAPVVDAEAAHYTSMLDQASRNAKPMPARKWQEMQRWLLLARYDAMPEPNVSALARELAQAKRERVSFETARSRIHTCLRERDRKIKDGTWKGPAKPKV